MVKLPHCEKYMSHKSRNVQKWHFQKNMFQKVDIFMVKVDIFCPEGLNRKTDARFEFKGSRNILKWHFGNKKISKILTKKIRCRPPLIIKGLFFKVRLLICSILPVVIAIMDEACEMLRNWGEWSSCSV